MAGIISNVDDDVQKLRKLKNEIENVKKALMGINITVDIDIAKGLQSQLTSLIGQYDALVDKIAATEGKIMLSVSRINKATEKIVQAQEKVSKVVNAPAQIGDANTQTNTAETASIQAQAKAYDDLKTKINDILGTRDANIKRMVEEMNAIRLINAEIKKINKSQGESSSLSSAQQKRLEQLNNSLLTHKTALSEVRQALNNNAKLDNVAATSMNGLSQSLSRMRIAYRELTEEERNSPFGKELLASIQQADTKIKELDATIGNHQRNVGNYGKQWNGLSMSIQQVGRELPSLAYGPKVFFSAISNNIPILADEIKRARTEYKLLKESGQAATPVWKQVVSSLFSWQSVLTVGITLLTLYGDKVVDWVAGLFKAKDALQDVASYQQNLSKIMSDSVKDSVRERVELDTLYKATQNHTKSLKERNAAADELKKKYPSYFSNLTNEAILAGNAASAYKNLTDNILKASQARAAMKIIEENYNKIYQLQKAINADTNWTNRNRESTKGGTATTTVVVGSSVTGYTQSGQVLTKEAAEYNRRTDALRKNKEAVELLNKANEELAKSIDIVALTEDITGNEQETEAEKLRKQTDKYNALLDKQSLEQQRSAEDLQMEVDEARIKAMDEGSAKTIAEMELNFEKEMQAIDRQKKDALRKKVEDARAAWEANPKNKGKSFDATDIKLSDDEQNYYDELYKIAIISNEKIYKDLAERYLSYADERLAIEKKFNDDISILQEARKKAEAKGDASEIAQIDRSVEKRTEVKNEDIFKLDAEQFKKNMNWEQVFGNLDKVSTDTLKKLKVNLKDFISSQKDLSPENLKELVDAIERIDDKVSERNPFEAMSVSFKSLKDATDAQREAQEAYNKTLKEGTDEEKKNAKATLESAKNNKQKALSEATTILHHGVDEIGQYVDAGNQVIGIMETLGTKTPEWLEGTMSGFGEMLDGLGSIDLMKPMSIVTGGLQTIKGALTSITSLGGVINWSGSNAKEVQDSINRLTDRNETLQTSIESLTDEIKASKGTKSVAAYRSAYEYQKEQNSNYLNIAREQAGYHNSHKSWQYYMRWSAEDLKWIQQNINKNFTGTSSLWELTPEEMEKLRSNVDIWTKMQNAGKGGYGERVTDKLDDYIEQAGKLEELTDNLYEGLTGMSFDSMYDSFVSSLMDMEKSAEDVADDISKYFMQAMLSNAIGEQFSDKLRTWYDKFGEAMKDDGTLDNNERKELMDEYMGYVDEAMKLRDELAAATGYDKISQETTSQSASSKGFQAMSQDTGEELNGRFTALQIAGEEIKNQNIIQSQSLNLLTVKADALLSINTETRNIADNTRDLIAQSYLELVQISENTGAIVKPIIQIQKDMAEVKNNTSKL